MSTENKIEIVEGWDSYTEVITHSYQTVVSSVHNPETNEFIHYVVDEFWWDRNEWEELEDTHICLGKDELKACLKKINNGSVTDELMKKLFDENND